MEGLWLSLLRKIRIIENITETCQEDAITGLATHALELQLLPLAQFRPFDVSVKERYAVTWKKDGKILDEFQDMTKLPIDNEEGLGLYTARVEFMTEEVRVQKGELTDTREYTVSSRCT